MTGSDMVWDVAPCVPACQGATKRKLWAGVMLV
jgi:hypothetical protein